MPRMNSPAVSFLQPASWIGDAGPARVCDRFVSWFPGHGRRGCASMRAVEAAAVGREARSLRFETVQRSPHGEIRSVVVRLRVPGLDASLRVPAHYATGFEDLVAFVNGLASDCRGWQGERAYESLEHDLRVTAIHDGHIRLVVQLRETSVPDGWSATGVVPLDPGEEMTRAAQDVAALLAPPGQ